MEPEFAEPSLPSAGVLEVGVATVDDDIALFEVGQERIYRRVGTLAGLYHDHDAPWAFERGNELLDGLSRQEGPLRAVVSHDLLSPAISAVEQCNPISVASHVAGKAAAHHGHANDADLSRACFLCRPTVRFGGQRTSLVGVVGCDLGLGGRTLVLVVFLVGSGLRFSRLCTLTRLLDAHDSPLTRGDHDSRSGAVASTDSTAASLRSSLMPWRA